MSLVVMVVLTVVAMVYFLFSVAILANTYGRYVLGVRVRQVGTGKRPTWGQAALRTLTTGLWPVEALFIVLSKSKRRLGDRLAGTEVVRYDTSRPVWKRMLPGLVGVVVAYSLQFATMPLINGRMTVADAAREYVRQELATEMRGAPRQIHIVDERAQVTLKLGDARGLRLMLEEVDHRWRVDSWEEIPVADVGLWRYSIQRGAYRASASIRQASFSVQ